MDREDLDVCYTRIMKPEELPRHFVREHDVVVVFTVAQNMAAYTKRVAQVATLDKRFKARMGLMVSIDVYDTIDHGMIKDCPVNTRDLYRETAIWSEPLVGLKSKATRCSRKEIVVEYMSLGIRTELVLPFLVQLCTYQSTVRC